MDKPLTIADVVRAHSLVASAAAGEPYTALDEPVTQLVGMRENALPRPSAEAIAAEHVKHGGNPNQPANTVLNVLRATTTANIAASAAAAQAAAAPQGEKKETGGPALYERIAETGEYVRKGPFAATLRVLRRTQAATRR